MDITQTKSEGLIQEFNICIPTNYVNQKFEEKLKTLSHKVKIAGFRPGKIPMPILQQRYGASVKNEVLDHIVQESVEHLTVTHNLRTATQPQIQVLPYEEGSDFKLNVTFETLPIIDSVDLGVFQFEKWVAPIEQSEIDQALENLQAMHAEYQDVGAKVKAKKGHQVHLAFYGTIEGQPIEGGSSEGIDLEIGSGAFIPGFEEQIIDMKIGDKKDFYIDFPEDYHAEDLKGKKAHFSIEIKKIREKALAQIDEEFARKLNIESIDELKEVIKDQIEQDHKYMSLISAKRDILDKFSERFKFDIPQGLKQIEFQSIWNQFEKESKETHDKISSEELEDLKKEYQSLADRRVRLGLLLAEIGREHQVTVSQQELEQALIKEAMKYPGMERKVIEYYRSNPQAQATLRAPLFEDKVIELILEKAQVSQKEVSIEELKKHIEELTQGEED